MREKVGSIAATVGNSLMILCAVAVAVALVKREFFDRPTDGTAIATHKVKSWSTMLSGGHRIGSPIAPVTIVEFGDFECPVCGAFERNVLRAARARYPNRLAVVFREWPLSYHPYAYPAARAAECAAEQGAFRAFHDTLYADQDSLGHVSFMEFALRSGVKDTVRFATCDSSAAVTRVITADVSAVNSLHAIGTPTLIVNGTMLGFLPDSAGFDSLMTANLASAK